MLSASARIAAKSLPNGGNGRAAARSGPTSPRGPEASLSRIRTLVPRISAFYGIIVTMHWREHLPPHFHAFYAGVDAAIAIGSGEVVAGHLPLRALRLVHEWAALHDAELRANWARAENDLPLERIAPLT